jgi:hypothetical protein
MWGDDIRGGGWCSCSTCAGMSPSDQALVATNLMADAAARVLPGATIAHLAYHDTLEPPTIEPRDNVTALFAPRERCYAHAIDDSACHRNVPDYWEPFTRFAGLFPAGRMQVFEYYSDAILFKGLAPTHLWTLPGDTRAYSSAGVWNMGNLMVGDRPWVGPPWHAWWTAKCLWDADANPQKELPAFCDGAFGDVGPAMVQYYRAVEEGYRRVLDLRELEPKPRHDVLDFSDSPTEAAWAKARDLAAALTLFGEVGQSLPSEPETEAERAQAEFVFNVVDHLTSLMTALTSPYESTRDYRRLELEQSERALADINAWDAQHSTPAYAVISRPMRRAMAWHINQIRALAERGDSPSPAKSGEGAGG